MHLRVGTATDVGRVRDHNEDAHLATGTLFLVADGMGGHAAGEVASGIVVETMRALADRDAITADDVVDQIARANESIIESASEHPERRGMGTTVTGVAAVKEPEGGRWAVFNVGDSRVYHYLRDRLVQVTVDHSEVREMVDAGVITAEQARHHPLRNIVTRSLGIEGKPDVDVRLFTPEDGERFVVCSDGLSNELTDDRMASILRSESSAQSAADTLVASALDEGGNDNVTVIVVDVVGDEPDAGGHT